MFWLTICSVLSLFLSPVLILSSQGSIGIFTHDIDVGPVMTRGETSYDVADGSYTISGAGSNVWFTRDEFHFTYKELTGDFIVRARGSFLAEGLNPHRKFGWMVRTDLDTSAAMVSAAVHGNGLASFQFRRRSGGLVEEVKSSVSMPDVIQLERRGRSFFLSLAQYGDPFWTVEVPDFDFPPDLLAGLFVCSHRTGVIEQAVFHNVRVVLPAPAGFVPYRDYIGSHLEVMNLATGNRKILYSVPYSIQAPNWSANGNDLIFNANGLVYRYDLKEKEPIIIPTDFVNRNNNDHVLSADGNMLGLSSSSGEAAYGSLIYTVAASGGVPKRITPVGPSYLHGWSPDGRWLTYTGGRDGIYDIYKIRADGSEPEIQLTHETTLDDGPEYSPDGQSIYFNSARTGSMELWRMKPNGSEPVQLTDDDYQNWFPHPSPDGKTLVFLSYMPDVDPAEHPFYRHVYLRQMPASGGRARVIGYLYGGQGTINVPSWSPDGMRIAFVSNTQINE